MIREEAKRIIKDTFENSFNKQKFSYFIKNLLKDGFEIKEFSRSGQYIKTAFKDQINKFERIGKYTDNEGNVIDILTVELINANSVERARTSQRNFIRWYLNGSMGDQLKDAALVAFYHPENSDWRFSFIKMQYSLDKKKDEFTPAKRYSYLVGELEHSHTAQLQLIELLRNNELPTLEQLENAFGTETVTARFFKEYNTLFVNLRETIEKTITKDRTVKQEFDNKKIDITALTKKTLGQIVFLYFLQKKGWLGVPVGKPYGTGDKKFLNTLFELSQSKNQNFFNDNLKYLFYDALAIERPKTDKTEKDFYQRFNCKIPFLNGGLFEPLNDYDWKNIDLKIENTLFHNSTLFADNEEGTGILNVFDRYNFTIKEDEPLEKEVAVDPEMLGKVFESLLDVTERKAAGAFYTPREIVHYMCQESLIKFLDTKCNTELNTAIPVHDIETFIRKGIFLIENDLAVENQLAKNIDYQIPVSIRKNAKQLDHALSDVLICDPAIGSGAFPVGLLTEIVNARIILYKLQNPHIANDYDKLEKIIYDYKRHCIHNSIYGVDIDNSAIDIAKLRLWLSLVVDESNYDSIKALPNLDYKIVCGNSLISLPHDIVRNSDLEKEIEKLKNAFFDTFDHDTKIDLRNLINAKIRELLSGAEKFISYKIDFDYKLYFSEVFRKQESAEIKILNAQIDALNKQIEAINKALHLKGDQQIVKLKLVTAQQQIATIELEIKNIEKSISTIYGEINTVNNKIVSEPKNFDYLISAINKNIKQLNDKIAELNKQLQKQNGNEGGFDIVIGNPPYIQLQKNGGELANLYETQKFDAFSRMGDIYCLFYENGIRLLKNSGIECLITSNKWMRAGYGEKLRRFLIEKTKPLKLIDFSGYQVFESATVDTNILLVQKNLNGKSKIDFTACSMNKDFTVNTPINEYFEKNEITISNITSDVWTIGDIQTQNIKQLINKIGKPLKEWEINIYFGMKTGYNEAFYIDENKKNELIAKDKKNTEIIKKVLRGKDIKKYNIEYANIYLLFIPWHFPIQSDNSITGDSEQANAKFQTHFPFVYEHLLKYKKQLSERNKAETGIRYEWYALQRCANTYYNDFFKEKIIYSEIVREPQFYYDTEGYFVDATSFLITGKNLKYLIALLNSKPVSYIFKSFYAGGGLGETGIRYKKAFLEKLPIPKIPQSEQKPFEILVDYILWLNTTGKPQASKFVSNKNIVPFFEEIINMMVYELYFADEMKAKEINVLQFAKFREISNIESDLEKAKIIAEAFDNYTKPDNPIRNRAIKAPVVSDTISLIHSS